MSNIRKRRSIVERATAYSGAATAPAFKMPTVEAIAKLSDEDLTALHADAIAAFDTAYGDGTGLSSADLQTLGTLTENIETLAGAVSTREALAADNADAAAALAARVRPAGENEAGAEQTLSTEEPVTEPAATAATENVVELSDEVLEALASDAPVEEDGTIVASGIAGKKIHIKLPSGRNRDTLRQAARQALASKSRGNMKDVAVITGEGLGFKAGAGVDFNDLGAALDHRLSNFAVSTYEQAAAAGRQIRQQGSFASFRRDIPANQVIRDGKSREQVESAIAAATDQSGLKGGSLLASGGWHAPSEILYNEYLELESRDGILSTPEIGVARGGVQITTGPSFAEIYADITGFHFTEASDIAGDYATSASGTPEAGSKPTYHVTPPDFQDYRLDVDGLIITSGLLGARGYPEHLARVIRGALVAHDHRINANVINDIAAGSDSVSLPAGQLGATAPILSAIELQGEHYRDTYRMGRNSTLEAVFPFWVFGAVRSDLSRRLGVDLIDVPDARIQGWFTDRGIAPQFVYDWQSPSAVSKTAFNQWPTSVDFLLYAAGTWVKGVSDILTLDTLYDSVLLGKNDYTALFTEEGWFVAKAGIDSRRVTVPISSTGAANIGEAIANSGAAS